MTAMNIVHMRVKAGREADFLKVHQQFGADNLTGSRNFWVVRTGDRDYCIVGEWQSANDLAAARPAMIASLDQLRPMLEDLGGGRGVTEPWSGEVQLHLRPNSSAESAM